MKRWVKWSLGTLVALVVVAAAAAVVGTQLAERKSQRHVTVTLQPVAWATGLAAPDAQTLARGKYLFNSRGCAECHGIDGAGREFINDGKGLRLKSPNISPGQGSVVARYLPEDWERTVRHGVKPDGRPVFIMPSEDYNQFTQDDLGCQRDAVRVAAQTGRRRCESGLRLPQDRARPALRPALTGGLPPGGRG